MIWDIDPILFQWGSLQIRYYGLVFVIGILLGYHLWRWQLTRQGYAEEDAEDFMLWGIIAVIVGARLGHCLFYEPGPYLRNPLRILFFWEGGLASHGATIALIIALYAYHRYRRIPLLHVLDCFSMSACMGAIFVRIGNFLNSEIVGRITDVPWAVRFVRYEWYEHFPKYFFQGNPADPSNETIQRVVGTPHFPPQLNTLSKYEDWYHSCPLRHPSQIYEVFLGLTVFFILYLVDRKYQEKRPAGLLAALFLACYFTGRFLVEYFKEYQNQDPTELFTIGQMLSIPFALTGYFMLFWIWQSSKKGSRTK